MSSSKIFECPIEIWQRIFALACTDGGKTGCSLSLVSKYVHEASEPFRYQTVLLEGLGQISALVNYLQEHPQKITKLSHLFVCDISPIRTPTYTLKSLNEGLDCLLRLVSDSLITLAMYMWRVQPYLLPPVSLNVVEEVTMCGDYHNEFKIRDGIITDATFPKLSKLYLQANPRRVPQPMRLCEQSTMNLLRRLSEAVPHIIELTLPTEPTVDWWYILGHTVGSPWENEEDREPDMVFLDTLFPDIRKVTVYAPPGQWGLCRQYYALKCLADLNGVPDPIQLELIEISDHVHEENPYTRAKQAWLDRCAWRLSA